MGIARRQKQINIIEMPTDRWAPPHRRLLSRLSTCLLRAFPPLLLGYALPAAALNITTNTTTPQTLNSDTTYTVFNGVTMDISGVTNSTVTVTGIAPVTFINHGTILNHSVVGGTAALYLRTTTSLNNAADGSIVGLTYGVRLDAGTSGNNVVNYGDISAVASHAISYSNNTRGTVDNYGTLNGNAAVQSTPNGIMVSGGANVTINNHAGASIRSGMGNATYGTGVLGSTGGSTITLNNDGVIDGYHAGVKAEDSGAVINVTNGSTGSIRGRVEPGVYLQSNSTLVNRGIITGDTGTAVYLAGTNNILLLDTGSNITGSLVSIGTGNALVLTGTGTLSNTATGFRNLQASAAAGQSWTLTQAMTLTGVGPNALGVTSGTFILGNTLTLAGGAASEILAGATLQLGNGGATGMVNGNIANNGTLVFNRSDNFSYSGVFSGSGSLIKNGNNAITLTGNGSAQGAVLVNGGILDFEQNGVFNAASLSTANGAGTAVFNTATLDLSGALTQNSGATLYIGLPSPQPVISAATASLNGALSVVGYSDVAPNTATGLASTNHNIIHTTGGITGDFSSVGFNGASSPVDYLTLGGRIVNGVDYNIGYGLTWLAGPAQGNGVFTVSSGTFTEDIALSDQTGPFGSGWDGKTLTKAGAGSLILSAVNSYTGNTLINAGALQIGVNNPFSNSASVSVAGGAVLNLAGFNAVANNLNGAGNVSLGSGTLTVNSNSDTTFSGAISGTGGLVKNGLGVLTLNSANAYSGGTLQLIGLGSISSGAAQIATGSTLFINAPGSGNYVFNNALTGTGVLQVALTGAANTFDFGAGVGSAFAGTAQLGTGSFTLAGANATALTNATLQLDAGNTTTIGSGPQNIGDLTFNGGSAIFSSLPTSIINTDTLTLNSGSVRVDPGNASVTGNLLAQDDGVGQQLISVASVVGPVSNLTLTDLGGNALTTSNANIIQGGSTVAVGTYSYSLGTSGSAGNGLYAQYSLTQLALQAGQSTNLSGDNAVPAGANELHAKITGSGELAITATNSITLNNGNNDYTGDTRVRSGALIAGADGAFGHSGYLILAADGTRVDLNGTTQTVGAILSSSTGAELAINGGNLTLDTVGSAAYFFDAVISGSSGSLTVGNANATLYLRNSNTFTGLTTVNTNVTLSIGSGGTGGSYAGNIVNNGTVEFNRSDASAYTAQISGSGSLIKSGTGALTLTGVNTYTGGTDLSNGRLIVSNGNALGQGGVIDNDSRGTLELAFAADSTLSNRLSGSGALVKSGIGVATLTGVGSAQGEVAVNAGTLHFAQSGVFEARGLVTVSGATTSIAADSVLILNGALTQNSGAVLSVTLGSAQPVIVADNASLDGTLNIGGFSATAPNTASALTSTEFTILSTREGISGDFVSINMGSATSPVDYLTLSGGKSGNDYKVGFGLTWLAGPTLANGVFTLADGATFNADVALADQTGSFNSGWDGKTLTKSGAGTLILSAANGYSGDTLINAGVLRTGTDAVFNSSANVTVAAGATLDLNSTSQFAKNLSGAGNVTLGSGTLIVNSNRDTEFSGAISGAGNLFKGGPVR